MSGILGEATISWSGNIPQFAISQDNREPWEGFFAYDSTTDWFNLASGAKCQFNDTRYNSGGNYDTTNSRYIAPANGMYVFQACVYTAQNDQSNSFGLWINGSKNYSMTGSHHYDYGAVFAEGETGDWTANWSVITGLLKNDYVDVRCSGAGGGDHYPGHSFWHGCRVR